MVTVGEVVVEGKQRWRWAMILVEEMSSLHMEFVSKKLKAYKEIFTHLKSHKKIVL